MAKNFPEKETEIQIQKVQRDPMRQTEVTHTKTY